MHSFNSILLSLPAISFLTSASPVMNLETEALKLGAPPELAPQFCKEAQLTALKLGASPELALEFSLLEQIAALKLGVSPKLALKFSLLEQLAALKLGVSPELAVQFTSYCQVIALTRGIHPELALQFLNHHQLDALSRGFLPELALQASTFDYNTVPHNLTQQFSTIYQIRALGQCTSPALALYCPTQYHLEALGHSIPPVLTLLMLNHIQFEMFELVMPIELALQIFGYIQFEASGLVIPYDMESQILNHLQAGIHSRCMLPKLASQVPPENDGSNSTRADESPAPDGKPIDAIPHDPRIEDAPPAANDVPKPDAQEYVDLAGAAAYVIGIIDESEQAS